MNIYIKICVAFSNFNNELISEIEFGKKKKNSKKKKNVVKSL